VKNGLLLLSGGIDSPVAGFLAIKQKAELFAVHFATEKITGKEPIEKAKKLCKILGIKKMFSVEVSDQFGEISKKCNLKLYFVLTKRLMLRIAEKIAKKNKLHFLLTGENIGQVSSQTLPNLAVIDKAVKMPVLRPLISFDKMQIIELARTIGTLKTSEGKEICDALGPKHPFTRTDLQSAMEEEKNVEVENLVSSSLKEVETYQP